jgi:YD repeat-containing protein
MRKPNSTTWFLCALLTLFLSSLVWFEVVRAETMTYTYDNLNRLTSAKYGNGQELKYAYDDAGNILTVTDKAPTATAPQEEVPDPNDKTLSRGAQP